MGHDLPVIDSCDDCGACCRVVTLPPFVRHLDGSGEEAWDRLGWDRPDLKKGVEDRIRALRSSGDATFGSACSWYDGATGRCRHHEYRPAACRAFALGGIDCHDARRRAGVG